MGTSVSNQALNQLKASALTLQNKIEEYQAKLADLQDQKQKSIEQFDAVIALQEQNIQQAQDELQQYEIAIQAIETVLNATPVNTGEPSPPPEETQQ